MKRFSKAYIILLVITLLLTGCSSSKSDPDAPETGIPIRISKHVLTVYEWKGTLSDSGTKVTIQATDEQITQIQTSNRKLIIFLTKSENIIENVAVDSVSGTLDANGNKAVILKVGQSLTDMGDFEVHLFLTNSIIVSKECVYEDEKGKYVWTVENDLSKLVGDSTATQSERKAVKLVNPKKVYVETGYSNEYKIEITSGLSVGDIIAKPQE